MTEPDGSHSTDGKELKSLLFDPFSPSVDTGFWQLFSKLKLEVIKSSDAPIEISGYFSSGSSLDGSNSLFSLDRGSLEKDMKIPDHCYRTKGTFINTNTFDAFKELNPKEKSQEVCLKMVQAIDNKSALENPEILSQFILLSYADLKDYDFSFLFCFPVLHHPPLLTSSLSAASSAIGEAHLASLISQTTGIVSLYDVDTFTVLPFHSLPSILETNKTTNKRLGIAIKDPGTSHEHPGWTIRNVAYAVSYWLKKLSMTGIDTNIVFIRELVQTHRTRNDKGQLITEEESARLYPQLGSLFCQTTIQPLSELPDLVSGAGLAHSGWERNAKGGTRLRKVSLKQFLDPNALADSAVDLNLNLMRWRLAPTLNLTKLKELKCLLLGSGTLGCYVGRILLGWGVRHITFVDRGKVAFSNPVRQPLFKFEDCLNGGRPKAEAAADALREILPSVTTRGESLTIRMPGHPVSGPDMDGKSAEEQAKDDVLKLENLIREHDAVFFLTDSREARWLPTMLCAFYGKIAINTALGFDQLVIMRHGGVPQADTITETPILTPSHPQFENHPALNADPHLGCYFCTDVTAPRNSFRDRTLDQQCTVTRPGLAPIASALAVETMVAITQSKLGNMTPVNVSNDAEVDVMMKRTEMEATAQDKEDNGMGMVPHQQRFFLSTFSSTNLEYQAYGQCTACSKLVRAGYAKEGFDFLLKVFNDPDFLEDVVGLKKFADEYEAPKDDDDENDSDSFELL
ncbi:putative ubiquitin-activating enzyme E1 [Blattamonas nauphoetae]|uniref:Ubiquitin-like modifier-activating enzyme ATG7 n=1 Tax=Blattamonas nauphoetae TaxID=2049346 RepID=A0ABQ9WYZ3_9EUKA|nr:putative ubiquitin-activating enzyme E1 [Blattamonas nauphoetae]